MAYSSPAPQQTQYPPPPPQYYTPTPGYDSPSISTPPVPPPKPSAQGTPPAMLSQRSPPPLPPPPRRSSMQAPTFTNHDREAWDGRRYDDGGGQYHELEPQHEGRYEQERYQQQQPTGPTMPPEGWVPEILLDKSKQDLHHLLSSPSLLTALLHHPSHTPPILTASLTPLQTQLSSNTSLAQHLSALEASLVDLRSTTSTHLLSTRNLESNWRKKQKDMEDKLEAWGPRELYNRLGASIQEGEGSCRAVEESWLEGEGVAGEREVGEWVRRVREGRRVVGLRRERRMRWDEGRVGGWR